MAKIWTDEHEQYIREHFRHKTYAELAEHFGVTPKAMESKIRRMGLKKQDYKVAEPPPVTLPPQAPEPDKPPVETGPTPIRSTTALPRRQAEPAETPEQREERLRSEREAAEQEKQRRAQQREMDSFAAALKAFEQGLAAFHDGALGKALQAFKKVAEAAPPDPVLVARARQYAAALERKGRSRSFDPQNADEYYLQGVVLLNDGDTTGALAAFERALEQAPGDDRILYCQAAAYAQKGDIDAAIAALREAIDINYANRIYAVNDPDFVPLRVHEGFRSLVSGDRGR